jgi:integrase
MAQSKFTLYKYIKFKDGSWRYCKAAFYSNAKIKPNRCIVGGKEEEHPEGSYYLYHRNSWIPVGADALDAQRRRNAQLDNYELKRLGGTVPAQSLTAAAICGKTPLAAASQQYFSNLEARGADPKTIRTYRSAVDPFIENCVKTYVEDVIKQDIINFMGWLRKQPAPQRRNSNPDRTYANKVGHVAIFLKTFGVSRLLKKSEYPQYEEKTVTAHIDDELEYLYAHADAEQRFLLDFGLNSGFRDGELSHAEYPDLVGNTLEVKRKPHLRWKPKKHHCRKVTVSQKFADAFRARGKSSKTSLVFPNEAGKPNHHLLRDLQALTKDARFHTELHKLRKTWATRLALAGMPLHVLQKRLGHKNLMTTQKYLADVDLTSKEHTEVVEKAAYTPKPKVVKTGTDSN